MAELVDALASGASERKLVEVQVLFRPPLILSKDTPGPGGGNNRLL